jgi:predicted RNA-binding Zn ribbon-like protein
MGCKLLPMDSSEFKPRFDLSGGHPCLDFANTLDRRLSEHPRDALNDYSDLVAWGIDTRIISRKNADRLLQLASEMPGNAKNTLRSALQLREALFSLFSAVANRRGIPVSSLEHVNHAIHQSAAHGHMVHTPRRFLWEWISPEDHLDSMLWPLARAAADLLLSDDLALVRQCAAGDCAWLFLDKTKNHRRRWCDMKTCGNRDKARRYYQRLKTS